MKKKSFVMLMCAVLVVASAALGTVAYLTDHSTVTNTFSVGNVSVVVDESDVNPDGTVIPGAPRVTDGNAYHLLPGVTYVKDPTMTVSATSESCYVRMLVTITKASELQTLMTHLQTVNPGKYPNALPQDYVNGWDNQTWPCVSMSTDAVANTITCEFRYQDKNAADAASAQIVTPDGTNPVVLDALFDSITVPGELTNEQLAAIAGFEIKVIGQAIQSTSFVDAQEAWLAYDNQYPATTNQQGGAPEGV